MTVNLTVVNVRKDKSIHGDWSEGKNKESGRNEGEQTNELGRDHDENASS